MCILHQILFMLCQEYLSIHMCCFPTRRPMPLTAAGGANAVNSTGADAAVGETSAPAVKKAKGELAKPRTGAAGKSKSLKRL